MIYLVATLLYTLSIVYICLDRFCILEPALTKHRVTYDFENRKVIIDDFL